MSRESFVDTWLCEAPMGIPGGETYSTLKFNIRDLLQNGHESIKVNDQLNKLKVRDLFYYWYGTDIDIKLAVELTQKPQGLVVSLIGKDPKLKGKAPWASDLYSDILKDSDESIRLISDKMLSDEGYNIWKKLLG